MAYSLNQIQALFRQFAVNHKQINSYGFGDPSGISSDKLLLNWSAAIEAGRESAPVYPLLWVGVLPSTIARRQVTFNLMIIVCDIVHKDETNQIEVLSDTQRIIQDITAWLQIPGILPYPIVDSEFEFQITPFLESKFDDETAGWTFDLAFNIVNTNDQCAVPMTGAPTQ